MIVLLENVSSSHDRARPQPNVETRSRDKERLTLMAAVALAFLMQPSTNNRLNSQKSYARMPLTLTKPSRTDPVGKILQ